MRFLTWGIIGAATIYGVVRHFGMANVDNTQPMAQSNQQGTTPVQLVANSNPLTANTPKQ